MFNFIPKLATGDIKLTPANRITQANLNQEMLVFAGDAAAAQIVRRFDPTLKTAFKNLPTTMQSEVNALTKGVRDILSGIPFTANIQNSYDEGRILTTFSIQSSSRPDVIYQPTAYECQCEGHEHHGVCKHRLVRKVFDIYVTLIQASETLQANFAAIGVELILPPQTPRDFPVSQGDINDFLDMLVREGISSEELFKARSH